MNKNVFAEVDKRLTTKEIGLKVFLVEIVKEYKLRLMKITKEQEMNDLFKEMEVKYENS